MRGGLRLQNSGNDLKHAVQIAQNFVIPEPNDPIALRFEERGSTSIVRAFGVLTAVYFNDQLSLPAQEVADEWADGDLTREFEAFELPAA